MMQTLSSREMFLVHTIMHACIFLLIHWYKAKFSYKLQSILSIQGPTEKVQYRP